MKEENIYMAIWKGSYLLGNLLLVLSTLNGWVVGYGIAGVLILFIPYICMVMTTKISDKKGEHSMQRENEASEEYLEKIKELMEQFEDEKE